IGQSAAASVTPAADVPAVEVVAVTGTVSSWLPSRTAPVASVTLPVNVPTAAIAPSCSTKRSMTNVPATCPVPSARRPVMGTLVVLVTVSAGASVTAGAVGAADVGKAGAAADRQRAHVAPTSPIMAIFFMSVSPNVMLNRPTCYRTIQPCSSYGPALPSDSEAFHRESLGPFDPSAFRR